MIDNDLRKVMPNYLPKSYLLSNPSFDSSIIGITNTGNVVYDIKKMTKEMSEEDNISAEDAMDFIKTNVIPFIDYLSGKKIKPIIIYPLYL